MSPEPQPEAQWAALGQHWNPLLLQTQLYSNHLSTENPFTHLAFGIKVDCVAVIEVLLPTISLLKLTV